MQYPPDLSERQKYLHLLAEVCETLKASSVDELARKDYPLSVHALNNVRMARKMSLPHLIALIETGLPNFVINPALLPAVKNPLFQQQPA